VIDLLGAAPAWEPVRPPGANRDAKQGRTALLPAQPSIVDDDTDLLWIHGRHRHRAATGTGPPPANHRRSAVAGC
jgi:hypothetical protein